MSAVRSIAEVAGWRVYVYALDEGKPHVHLRKAGVELRVTLEDPDDGLNQASPADARRLRRWLLQHQDEVVKANADARALMLPSKITGSKSGGTR
ncbi:MAG: DUF4160 domain-containing protein [Sulfobacillus sp.]